MDFEIPGRVKELETRYKHFITTFIDPLKTKHPHYFGVDADRVSVTPEGYLTEEIQSIRKTVRKNAVREGLYGIHMSADVGGLGLTQLERVLLTEYITDREPSTPILWPNLQAYMTGEVWGPTSVLLKATPAAREKYLPGFMNADLTQCIALTDPLAGSDPQNMDTTAVRRGDRYIINGEKVFIGNGALAEVLMVYARTSGKKGDHKGLSMFLVERGTPGLSVKRMFRPLEGIGNHAHLQLTNCEVGAENLVGEEGRGLYLGLEFIAQGRLRHGATGVGASSWLLREAIEYVKTRNTFGEPLASRQGIRWQLAEASTMIEQLRWLVRHAAWKVDRKVDAIRDIAMAKMQGAIVQGHVSSLVMQLFGGIAFMADLPMERAFRHARMYSVTEGSIEIQKQTIAKQLFA